MITEPLIPGEALLKIVGDFYQDYVVFLIDDTAGTLPADPTLVDVAPLEIDELYSYARQSVPLDPFTVTLVGTVEAKCADRAWTFSGGSVSFTHIAYAVGATLTNKDVTGTLERLVPANDGNTLTIPNQGTYLADGFTISQQGGLG